MQTILDSLPIYIIYFAITLIILLSFEIGYRLNKNLEKQKNKKTGIGLGEVVGGLIAMLGFLLAFTFSMASTQYEIRKKLVLEEANEIGTAYLRADLIAEPHQTEIKHLLKNYVDTHLKAINNNTLNEEIKKATQIQKQLWNKVVFVTNNSPNANTSFLLIQSINNIIDLQEKRINAALRDRIPISIWGALAAILILTMLSVGIQSGYNKSRKLIMIIPLALAFSAITTLIVDLNRSQEGSITIGQQSMISLQKSIQKDLMH